MVDGKILPHFSNILCKVPAARFNSVYEKGAMSASWNQTSLSTILKKSNGTMSWIIIIRYYKSSLLKRFFKCAKDCQESVRTWQ